MFTSVVKAIRSVYCIRDQFPRYMSDLLSQEEQMGALFAVRFRYVIGVALVASAVANLSNTDSVYGYLTNYVAISFYFINTFVHAQILKKSKGHWKTKYDYISLFIDNLLVTVTIFNWYILKGDGNPNFLVKTPLVVFYLLPLSLSLFQYRFSLVNFSFVCFLLSYYGFLIYALVDQNSVSSDDWHNYVLGDQIILSDASVTKPTVYLVLVFAISYAIFRSLRMLLKFAAAESQKTTLSRYFSPDLVSEIVSEPEVIAKGKRQKVTVLFSDIRGFTQMSESMDPEALSVFLTEFRRRMVRAIFKYGGSLDKFIGDAVMATFGTPSPSDIVGEDSKSAVLAAKCMLDELENWNLERSKLGKSQIKIGIGIHTGEVFCGSIGSEERMEYTVIGDTVNTASRIESACKDLRVNFLISEAVWLEIGSPTGWDKKELVTLLGREQKIHLYAPSIT
ncbi:adenylate/guanylate cyclase domain-containing protein [Leptospira sp. 2 VSF19]|uniref:Adenylate/guanylate cyclase domain-containing protein n=1 Tax=Leptospira soteropolitanensis TaxID=2950025 RepID=A0AAW5VGQ6_9LEPT|nr:adenylate/guanylate cyclase domain-containing protein [Leptospira soteropolitanensis]MCW7494465.1 adenylate/guanylate cyclase domain-containing protein [Leptospira soteropolitanensis]MCW7502059.1 adenylate/guanylate cyclase domain-containing protein [Leptospira soteropolitanensis]MCW7524311.1 adenylate/guanylate cyclase domain-containing protein [Leptospira soteropolitanensis]MCW7528176.1 adenylate/guanylate cyclase domain-containing protein [Leptospira soteropolitanensis]MCW7532029.1 adeny